MGRQQQQQRHRNNDALGVGTSDLWNFHFATAPPSQQQQQPPHRNRHSNTNHHHHHHYNHHHSRQPRNNNREDRASSRKRASQHNFYLHSSPDHSFIVSRRMMMKQQQHQQQQYSLQGPDPTVSWASVQMVLYRCVVTVTSPSGEDNDDEERCPICLDAYTCPRITKCGHIFCYPCLLHHMQTYSDSHPYSKEAPKCPCCSLGVHLDDVRPVQIQSLLSITTTGTNYQTFVKLHRVKTCPAPYLPLPECPRRSSPHAVPCQTDVDAIYSKFQYVDPLVYQSHLTYNLQELQSESLDPYSLLAQDKVQIELQQALSHMDAEVQQMQQFANSTAGIYQGHPPCFLYVPPGKNTNTAEAPPPLGVVGRPRGESMGSESYQSSVGEDSVKNVGETEESSSVNKKTHSPSKAAKNNRKGHKQHHKKNSQHPKKLQASMFLDPEEETLLYQAQDGSLCFLSAFNMKCLRAEFSVSRPPENHHNPPPASPPRKILPLPDQIQGKVVEIEKVHLTPSLRSRIRCLSHLPLYMDICFVELDLKHILSASTKKLFAKEFQAKQRSRQKKETQEQREQALANQQEQERIDRLKSSLMISQIDPDDPFFQPVLVSPPVEEEEEIVTILGDDFGPSLGGGGGASSEILVTASPPTSSRRTTTARQTATMRSFSQITREGGAFPSFVPQPSSEEDFPSLSGSASASTVKPRLVEPGGVTAAGGKKKKKTKGSKTKILLFSTDSHRTAF